MRRVYVTGLGVISALGFGRKSFWANILAGQDAAAAVEAFDTTGMDRTRACEVKGFRPRDFLTAAEARRTGRCAAMALAAARQAVEESGLTPKQLSGPRTSVVLGTTMGEANLLGRLQGAWLHESEDAIPPADIPRYGTTLLPIHVARAFGAEGMVQTLPAACAAGNYAIGYAADQIRAGRADIVITGASEVLEKLQYAGFVRLGAMTPDHVRPFDKDRKGLLVGEGAGILVLESEESVRARDATPLAEVGGYGLACDAHHITRPHPEGAGLQHAVERAIASSGLRAEDVSFVNAHGTATMANDEIESKVLANVFGPRGVPVSSVKSMIGHCMGAASAIEAVTCVMSIESGMLPPTIHYETPDPECDVDLVANEARAQECRVVLNDSAAFGGYDAVVAFAKTGVLPDTVGEG